MLHTPASTLVMSRTLIPASGPCPLVEATEAKHLRRPRRVLKLRFAFISSNMKGLCPAISETEPSKQLGLVEKSQGNHMWQYV